MPTPMIHKEETLLVTIDMTSLILNTLAIEATKCFFKI